MKHLHLADDLSESFAKTTEYKLLKYIVQIDKIDGRVHNVMRTAEIPLSQESIEMDALRINADKKEKLSYWLIYETDDSALQALAEFAAGTAKQCFEDADLIKQMAKDLDDISQKYLRKFLGREQ